jgi:Asp-tRNA(Asn)/Glu-tRNA(Gln) amidotransferase A subunit family amidase
MLRKALVILLVAFGLLALLWLLLTLIACKPVDRVAGEGEAFPLEEATISQIHAAFRAGELNSRQLVERYLDRITAYDRPDGLNALVVINPRALERADELDAEFRATGSLRPLHGIPVIVKDNYETHDLQTTAGSAALAGWLPPDDAYQVRAIREAGAVVLAKSNMAEWAFSPYETESSIAGITRNPYDLARVPAGSSGGTAAAVAANLGAVGLGTDTGNSIRGPSAHTGLVGLRPTIGLTSRDGILPLYLRNDVGGPMTRCVEDTARLLGVISGYDPADPVTEAGRGRIPEDYLGFLDRDGLKGARLGVLRFLSDTPTADAEIAALFQAALADLRGRGAEVIDPFLIPGYESVSQDQWCDAFRHDINAYFVSLGENAPVKDLEQIVESGRFADSVERRLQRALLQKVPPEERDPPRLGVFDDPKRIAFRDAILSAMDRHRIDALIYPSWNNPPREIGDRRSPHGNNSPQIAPHTGQPALTVPMGFTSQGLPAGLQLLGRPFDEGVLLRLAYAYEQATEHRRPPELFPPLKR